MTSPDLRAVDELCRLVLAARRMGCRVHLSSIDPELRELLDLAGVDAVVSAPGSTRMTVGLRTCSRRGMLRSPAPLLDRPVR